MNDQNASAGFMTLAFHEVDPTKAVWITNAEPAALDAFVKRVQSVKDQWPKVAALRAEDAAWLATYGSGRTKHGRPSSATPPRECAQCRSTDAKDSPTS